MWNLNEIIDQLKPLEILKPQTQTFNNICIDSRTIEKDDIFLAFKGEFKDGHDFIDEAFKRQCGLCICEKTINKPYLKVNDSKKALKNLASFNKLRNKAKVIAIVGSVGKTSTKELLKSYFSAANINIFYTQSNENNWIGVCKTLLRASCSTQFGIVEVGTNHKGEIADIASFLKPDFVIFTEIGTSHLGNFDSIEAIFKEKTSIVNFLTDKKNVVYNKDNALLKSRFSKNHISYSNNDTDADVYIIDCKKNEQINILTVKVFNQIIKFSSPFWLNISNILSILAFVGSQKLLDADYFQKALNSINLPSYRMQLEKLNSTNFILDCYNASFESIKFAINELNTKKGKKLAILGDVLELGSHSESLHKEIGEYIAGFDIDTIAYGKDAKYIALAKNKALFFENKEELSKTLKATYENYDWILIKGSRGLKMEEIFNNLKKEVT
ncbi:UDP-N-acetylmuramoylalanyl-D-glutamyl-2,6- diaminopimelate--D-alanyl-D-alanine ligase [Desulfurella amilsii]|uniref:UDP-N-acetylmuramoyl-tripeptide--D-alanyl-D-alanine ligase n=1 Tax=Desulfurella amilsii TaxID=1562698 RepID=A0A1X4XVA8_9BACT|nr:UDP-N-acetylmuramoyl-tripeptide--D-alanyl-D-alanine ligase [Desulfurella amilsii]OSS41483.1 UDP-N-acetylmuramoylalanyl-D-glutamyl-2,6- diaminopimelate--D-alanyl-D-alanine ligase [Desulfurella amilsii]